MGYRGRKRRLKNFDKQASEFARSVNKSGGLVNSIRLLLDRHSNRHFFRANKKENVKTRNRLALKDEEDLVTTMHWQKQIMGDIKSGKLKPKHFKYVPFKAKILKGEYFGIQEYFHKPNAEQLLSYLKAVKEKRLATRHNEYLTKDEYELCKKFMKNPVNSRINIQKIESTVNELLNYMGGSGNWQEMHHHNILIQGINRDGTLRITLIDV